ncbi:MAG: hypothetical protein RR777_05415, partial [Christensenellaceae bacterium]
MCYYRVEWVYGINSGIWKGIKDLTEKIDVAFNSIEQMAGIFGSFDENINILSNETNTVIRATNNGIVIEGE